MSKLKKLKKKLNAFVNQLTPDEIREQLVLAYLQMERCLQVLRGEDVEPVSMKDNGLSSDLELFYMCKKKAEELSLQEKEKNTIKFCVEFDCDEAIKQCGALGKAMKELHEQLEKKWFVTSDHFIKFMRNYERAINERHRVHRFPPVTFEDFDFIIAQVPFRYLVFCDLAGAIDERSKNNNPKTPVYFMSKGRIHKSFVEKTYSALKNENKLFKVKGHAGVFYQEDLYATPEELAVKVCEKVCTHVSYSEKVQSSFFIDKTSRVFRGATWYLEDQQIEHFDSLEELKNFLVQNIVDDGTGKND